MNFNKQPARSGFDKPLCGERKGKGKGKRGRQGKGQKGKGRKMEEERKTTQNICFTYLLTYYYFIAYLRTHILTKWFTTLLAYLLVYYLPITYLLA